MRGVAVLALIFGAAAAACNDGSSMNDGGSSVNDGSATDSGAADAPGDGAQPSDGGATDAPDCYTNPTTHFEIINACTDAQALDKSPVLPLLQPDGSLPPLP